MSMTVGPYRFPEVDYNQGADLLDLAVDGRWGVGSHETPEGHWWFVADQRSEEIVALQLLRPRELLARNGRISVTLPSGERADLEGAEPLLKQPA